VGDVDLDTQIAPLILGEAEPLTLHIFYDRSVIEIFANQRVCLTSRIYPLRPDSRGISVAASGASGLLDSLDVWELDAIW
jgi:beta-fructofuranosidase